MRIEIFANLFSIDFFKTICEDTYIIIMDTYEFHGLNKPLSNLHSQTICEIGLDNSNRLIRKDIID